MVSQYFICVITWKSQLSPNFLTAVWYWSYVSPGSCDRRLNRYFSSGIFLWGWQYCLNFANTGSIFASSPGVVHSLNIEITSLASSPITVSSGYLYFFVLLVKSCSKYIALSTSLLLVGHGSPAVVAEVVHCYLLPFVVFNSVRDKG